MRLLSLIVALLLLGAGAAQSAPPRPRPDSGCGVLLVQPEAGAGRSSVVLYQEPGVLRLGELDAARLPRLGGSESEPLLTATARKGGWSRVSYDDAGREGWVEQGRSWRYLPWDDFLPGRQLKVLPGLKKGQYAVRSKPDDRAPEMASLRKEQEVRVLRVEEGWALLEAPMGWFRWRDGDGGEKTLTLHHLHGIRHNHAY
jgi:hypothetical protein